MIDQEKDRLIAEALGENSNGKYYFDVETGKTYIPAFDTWEGFGWIWPRLPHMDGYEDFMDNISEGWVMDGRGNKQYFIRSEYIDPPAMRNILAEFLERK